MEKKDFDNILSESKTLVLDFGTLNVPLPKKNNPIPVWKVMTMIRMPCLWRMKKKRKTMNMKRRTKKMSRRKRVRKMIMGLRKLKMVLMRSLD
jgi:hypothetical protein